MCNVHILNILGWPYVPFFPDASWSGFLYCLKYLGFSTVCVCIPIGVWHQTLQTVPYVFKTLSRFFDVKHWSFWATLLLSTTHLICTRNCIVLTIDPTFSHTHWSTMYNACMLLVKLLFDHYLQPEPYRERELRQLHSLQWNVFFYSNGGSWSLSKVPGSSSKHMQRHRDAAEQTVCDALLKG